LLTRCEPEPDEQLPVPLSPSSTTGSPASR
jgi:hypothetical protein